MSNKRRYYVANATNQPILVKASDDESNLVRFKEKYFKLNAAAGANATVADALSVDVSANIGYGHHQGTFEEKQSTKPGFVKIAPKQAVRFEGRAYITYATVDFSEVWGPIDAPTKCQSLIITEDGLLKSKVLPSSPKPKHVFTDELTKICYIKTARVLEEDGVTSDDVRPIADPEGDLEEFEDYDLYDD